MHVAGDDWQDTGLVFTTHHGAALDAGNVRKMFKRICTEAGVGDGWTPRELRTTFVSLMSHQGVSIEEIAGLAGHATTRTTEIVYRRELRPVITTGAEIMDLALHPNLASAPASEPPKDPHTPAAGPPIPDFPAPQAAAIQPTRPDITQCDHPPAATSPADYSRLRKQVVVCSEQAIFPVLAPLLQARHYGFHR